MSHRRHSPAKLLCLVTTSVLIFGAVQSLSPHHRATSTEQPIADSGADGSRYPASLAQMSSTIDLVDFTFEPPPLPIQRSESETKQDPPIPEPAANSDAPHTSQGATSRRKVSPSEVSRLPAVKADQVPPLPATVSGTDEVRAHVAVVDDPRYPQFRRLPPVDEIKNKISFMLSDTREMFPTNPLRESTSVTDTRSPADEHNTSIASSRRTFRRFAMRPFEDEVTSEIENIEIGDREPRNYVATAPVLTAKTNWTPGADFSEINHSAPVGTGLAITAKTKPTELDVESTAAAVNPRRASVEPTKAIARQTRAIAKPTDHVEPPIKGISKSTMAVKKPAAVVAQPAADGPAESVSRAQEASLSTTRSVLANRIPGPNPALVAVSRQSMDLVRSGQSLAVRNAQYSARADFVQALRLIAQAHDAAEGGSRHSKALAAGLLALREAQDFIPRGSSRWTDQFDVYVIAAAHGTPILREQQESGAKQEEITPWLARQRYYTFAQESLAESVAGDAVASAALSSLGKLYVGRDGTSSEENLVSSAQAMAFFQSALQVDSRNYTAANELGVLLARYGQLQDARRVLQHGVAIQKDFPPLWRNLAVVHQRLGEIDLERRARHEFLLAQKRVESENTQADVGGSIRWVDADAFVRSNPAQAQPPRTAAQPSRPSRETEAQKPGWRFWK